MPELGVQFTPQVRDGRGLVWAARVTFDTTATVTDDRESWTGALEEASVFVIGPFGRLELGERAGFPQTLLGYAPSEIAFTPADYGPESGVRLTPNGRLPTRFLSPGLASQIDALTYLGYAARGYDIASPKLIYVSPRRRGFYAAVSYAPRTERSDAVVRGRYRALDDSADGFATEQPTNRFDDLVQAALVYQKRTARLDVSTGLTFAHAVAVEADPTTGEHLEVASIAGGLTAILDDTWTLGLGATFDGFSSGRPGVGRGTGADPFGAVGSLEYVNGRWTLGGYYQYARAVQDAGGAALHRVHIGQIGAAYLLTETHDLLGEGFYTDVKVFGSAYIDDFEGSDPSGARRSSDGAVLLAGVRFSFF